MNPISTFGSGSVGERTGQECIAPRFQQAKLTQKQKVLGSGGRRKRHKAEHVTLLPLVIPPKW